MGGVSILSTRNLATTLWRLPPTLHIKTHITTTSYSKVSRGLRFPQGITGLCTSKKYSEAPIQGQWRSRCAIHAGRHSNDKAFRYLKRVIVTPAVYQLLAPLYWSLKYWHWADVTFCTHRFRLAESCVFVKQSDHLDLWTLRSHLYRYKCRDPLYRRYGANLPSSLGWFKPSRLRFLA